MVGGRWEEKCCRLDSTFGLFLSNFFAISLVFTADHLSFHSAAQIENPSGLVFSVLSICCSHFDCSFC